MRIAVVGLLALMLMSACSNSSVREAQHQENLRTWFGSRESDLVGRWGPPTSVYEADGKRYLTYARSQSRLFTYPSGNRDIWTEFCTTTFTVSDGVISAWRYEGTNCF